MFNTSKTIDQIQADITDIKKIANDTLACVLKLQAETHFLRVEQTKAEQSVNLGIDEDVQTELRRGIHPLLSKEAADKANAKLGIIFYQYRWRGDNSKKTSPFHELELDGHIEYSEAWHKYTITDKGKSSGLVTMYPNSNGRLTVMITPIKGVNWLRDRALKVLNPEMPEKKEG